MIEVFSKENKSYVDFEEMEYYINIHIKKIYGSDCHLTYVRNFEYRKMEAEQDILIGNGFYIVISGSFDVSNKKFVKENIIFIERGLCKLTALSELHIGYVNKNFDSFNQSLRNYQQDKDVEFLQQHLFTGFLKNTVARLSEIFTEVEYPYQYVLYRTGDQSQQVYLIKQGEVKLINDQSKLISKGALFGEFEVFQKSSRIHTALVVSPLIALVASASQFLSILRDFHSFRQYLLCQSVIKNKLKNDKLKELEFTSFHIKPAKKKKKKTKVFKGQFQNQIFKTLSPENRQKDCEEIFLLSQQIHKERIKTGIKRPTIVQSFLSKSPTVLSPTSRMMSPYTPQKNLTDTFNLHNRSNSTIFQKSPSRIIINQMKIQNDSSPLIESSYKEYPSRWFHLTLFLCALVSNIVFGFSLSPIAKELSKIYDVEPNYLNLLIVSFTIFSALMIIPGNIISEKYGIETNVKIGCALTFIGAMVSLFIKQSFWFLYAGEIISLIGFPFRLISASKFTANWFFPENRLLITVFIALVFNSSSGLSIRIPLLIFGDYDINNDNINFDEGKKLSEELVYFLAIVISILTLPSIFLLKGKPRSPPSFTASNQCVRENYTKAAKALFKNKNYLKLATTFSLILGPVLLLTVQMEFIVQPYQFGLSEISNLIGLGVIAGLLGDLIVGTLVKKLQKFKIVLQSCCLCVSVFYALLILSLYFEEKLSFFICYFIVCGTSSIMALTFEFSCELSFPVSETSTIAFLGLIGNGLNFVQAIPEILILNIEEQYSSIITLSIMFGITIVGNISAATIEERLVRTEQDKGTI